MNSAQGTEAPAAALSTRDFTTGHRGINLLTGNPLYIPHAGRGSTYGHIITIGVATRTRIASGIHWYRHIPTEPAWAIGIRHFFGIEEIDQTREHGGQVSSDVLHRCLSTGDLRSDVRGWIGSQTLNNLSLRIGIWRAFKKRLPPGATGRGRIELDRGITKSLIVEKHLVKPKGCIGLSRQENSGSCQRGCRRGHDIHTADAHNACEPGRDWAIGAPVSSSRDLHPSRADVPRSQGAWPAIPHADYNIARIDGNRHLPRLIRYGYCRDGIHYGAGVAKGISRVGRPCWQGGIDHAQLPRPGQGRRVRNVLQFIPRDHGITDVERQSSKGQQHHEHDCDGDRHGALRVFDKGLSGQDMPYFAHQLRLIHVSSPFVPKD
jgi:hypothetical protein